MVDVDVLSPQNEAYPKDRLATWFPTLTELHAIGNPNLLHLPLTALFCSRKCTGEAILKAYDLACELRDKETPVISGFHTPVEKDMLDILLKRKGPIVWCPARGLEGIKLSKQIRSCIDQSRMLVISRFAANSKRIEAKNSEERNLLVSALATKFMFIYIEPHGNLLKLFNKLNSPGINIDEKAR